MSKPAVVSAISFAPLTADDLADIHSLFGHTVRTHAEDLRDLRIAAKAKANPVHARAHSPALSFSLREVFSNHTK